MIKNPLPFQEEPEEFSNQDTMKLLSIKNGEPEGLVKWLSILPAPLEAPLKKMIVRVWNSASEVDDFNSEQLIIEQTKTLGWVPYVSLISTLGIILIAFAFASSRDGGPYLSLFYPGLILIFSPSLLRLLSPSAPRNERVILLCMTGIYCYLVEILSSPLYFSLYDEFLHVRTADDMAQSGHLFTANSLLPVSPYYPGLEVVTNALSTLGGLDTFLSGHIMVGVARLLMILVLFALYEHVIKSSRIASIATMIYMTNPHFIFFDSQYGYESLALPLAVFIFFTLVFYQTTSIRIGRLKLLSPIITLGKGSSSKYINDLKGLAIATWIVLIALVITHHVSNYFLDGLLFVWLTICAIRTLGFTFDRNLTAITLIGILLSIAYIFNPGNTVISYLFSYVTLSVEQIRGLFIGTNAARPLFVTYAGPPTPIWERLVMAASFGMVMMGIPFGLLYLWKHYRTNTLMFTFGIISPVFMAIQLLRFTTQSAQLVDRVAPFLYLAIAAVLAIFVAQFWPIRQLNWKRIMVLTCVVSFVFLGGTIQGSGANNALLPAPYAVIADSRSIEPEGIEAAKWTKLFLGANNPTASDRMNQILMGSYGDQNIVTAIQYKADLSPVFLSTQLGPQEIALLREVGVRYLVVDLRLTKGLPVEGYYYDSYEEGAYRHQTPIDPKAFTKFDTMPGINKVFNSGNIIIYDVGDIANG